MGTLYIVSTPIGNLEDITIRAIRTLLSVPIVACEDTRVTGSLKGLIHERFMTMAILNTNHPSPITAHPNQKFVSYRDENEAVKSSEIVGYLRDGMDVALVSDAGTPLISDPGYKLVQNCIAYGIPVTAVPGASSIITGLTLSGLAPQPFWYYGYPPIQAGKRLKFFHQIRSLALESQLPPTISILEAPHRLLKTLKDMHLVFDNPKVAVCRELTKAFEEVYRGPLCTAIERITTPKGEYVIFFSLKQE